MKKIILTIIITIGKCVLNLIYCIFKLFPINQNKIVFMSRQSNSKSLDFEMLENELKKLDKNIKIICLFKMLNKGLKSKIQYINYIFKSMYHLATSSVCIVDTYCIPVSVLKHKKKLKIVQIWHASGAIKKFGYQVADKKEGTSGYISRLMNMHKNYDYIISPSSKTDKFFSEAFNTSKDKIVRLGLPRLEYIADSKYDKSEEIFSKYPRFKEKKNILYIPTFRKGKNTDLSQILNYKLDEEKYNLIISLHPLDKTEVPEKYIVDKKYSSFDLIKIADYIITDYSALSIEASVLEKPIFIYLFDYDEYEKNRGLNINIKEELSTFTSTDFNDIITKIENKDYDIDQIRKYKKRYIEVNCNTTSKDLAEFILKKKKKKEQ